MPLARSLTLCLLLLALSPAHADEATPQVLLETNHGPITVALYAGDAPRSVANFLDYVKAGFYDGTLFHRVIPGFMIQGGGFTTDMVRKPTREPIQNEADNGRHNLRGTLAMARTQDPHSASSQFFINVVDNDFLDHQGKTPRGWGYAVFGEVVDGMNVVDEIAGVTTGNVEGMSDVPLEPVVIEHARVVEPGP